MRSKVITVALLGVVLLAGCTGTPGGAGTATLTDAPTDTPTQTPSNTATATATATTATDGAYNAFTFESVPVTPELIAKQTATQVADLEPAKRDLALAALANGSATDVRLSHGDRVPESPGTLQDGEYVRRNGTYYRVKTRVVDRTSGEGYPFSLFGPIRERHDDYDVATENAVPMDSLTPTQRDLFESALPHPSRLEGGTVTANLYYLPPDGHQLRKSGWLDGDAHYVRHDGDLFRVRYADSRNPTVVRMQVRYSLKRVAGSSAEFIQSRLDQYVVPITDANPADPARSVILSTIENRTYEWEGTVETRPRSVELANDWVSDNSPDGSYVYVRYEGEIYRIQVTQVIE